MRNEGLKLIKSRSPVKLLLPKIFSVDQISADILMSDPLLNQSSDLPNMSVRADLSPTSPMSRMVNEKSLAAQWCQIRVSG